MTMHKGYYNSAGQMSSYEAQEDGSLLVHDVVVMAAGTWTDMHGITTTFSPDVLQRCAGVWEDNALWTRHAGGTPRSVTDKVGAVINPRYSPAEEAVMADLILHNQTDASRACSALVQMAREAGGIKDVSAETRVDIDRDGTVLDVVFTGLALVEDGACETCRLPAYSAQEEPPMTDEEIKDKTDTEVEVKDGEETTSAPDNSDLLDQLVKIVGAMIPGASDIIEEVMDSEGEDRIRALGKLDGCMEAWGIAPSIEDYSKMLDDKLAAFSKGIQDQLTELTNQTAQFSAPQGLKGRMGAEKEDNGAPQTVVCFGRGVPRY